jgi:hypothetical protein
VGNKRTRLRTPTAWGHAGEVIDAEGRYLDFIVFKDNRSL